MQTMRDELKLIEDNNTWTLTNLPSGQKPIGLKWVYKLKHDADDGVLKHKGRLMAKGYVHRPGIYFEEVFSPVARLD
jgi:hypothetical protein